MEHKWDTDSPRAFVFPHRVTATATGPVAQQYVPDESGQRSWEDLEAPASVCGEILRLAKENERLALAAGEAEAALLMAPCGCSGGFRCSRCKALDALRPHVTPPAQEGEEPPETSSPDPRD